MSKLQELIRELCPGGVEYKTLEDIGSFFGGLTGKSKEDFKDGNAKFITYRNVYSNPSLNMDIVDKVKIADDEKQHVVKYGDILFTGSSETPDECGMSSVVTTRTNEELYLNSFCFGLRLHQIEKFDLHYLKHVLRSNDIRTQIKKTASGVTRYNVSKKRFAKISIPVPPLPVQEEIVRILDYFTNLAAELQAELQARKEQYEYYRNKLLSFNNINGGGYRTDVTWMKMSEICKIYTGGEPPKDAIKGNYKDSMHPYPIWGNGKEVYGYASSYIIDKDATVISSIGANAGTVYFRKAYFTPIIRLKVLIPKSDNVLSKFLYFYLSTISLAVKSSSVPNMNANDVKKLLIPVPSLAEQQRIVSILDKFEVLVNDLTEGLPAEIAAVQEQYEYYRNKLLSFPKITAA